MQAHYWDAVRQGIKAGLVDAFKLSGFPMLLIEVNNGVMTVNGMMVFDKTDSLDIVQ